MQYVEANGARIPAIGFGTMTLKETLCVDMVSTALRSGWRHLDTAQMYGNEREVGEGLRASGVKREDVFLTTKVWWDKLGAADLERSVDESLTKLGVPFVDLLLIHWPSPTVPLSETIPLLNKVKREGKTKHIGVANFNIALLDEATRLTKEPLVNEQLEVHPFLDQTKILGTICRHGLTITAYCPIARGKAPGDTTLERIGKAHGKTPGQVSLRWLIQQGIIPIPRTSKKERLTENMAVFDFTLSDAEMADIAKLKRPDGRIVSPSPQAPKWDS